mmetsp:Transcript_4631/g.8970  ORF Transcript_4631/g.8970 Transcript_4631/m.8970 type:complete len:510 (+) Transcript_4631:83-1612(+)
MEKTTSAPSCTEKAPDKSGCNASSGQLHYRDDCADCVAEADAKFETDLERAQDDAAHEAFRCAYLTDELGCGAVCIKCAIQIEGVLCKTSTGANLHFGCAMQSAGLTNVSSADSSFSVRVTMMSGRSIEISQLRPTLMMSELLHRISDASGIPPTCMQLLDEEMQLLTTELDKKLCETSIKAGTNLTLMNTKLATPSLKELCPVLTDGFPDSFADYRVLIVSATNHFRSQTYELRKCLRASSHRLAEFEHEVEVLRGVESPFIRGLVTTYHTPQNVYALYEYVSGMDLFEGLRVLGLLSRQQAAFYSGSLLVALQALSAKNIVHRDIKPETVWLDKQGYPKLTDFKIAKKLGGDNDRTYTMIGTMHYLAPEVIRGKGFGTAADIWSLGCMLYEFVVGNLPFGDDLDDPMEVARAVLRDPLEFPRTYGDDAGRELMQGLLGKRVRSRLSVDSAQNANFFSMCDPSFFQNLTGRRLDAPLFPRSDQLATQKCSQTIADDLIERDSEVLPDF